ncbi:DUF560 domain-containing protein [Aquicoccus sp. SCR17]|nr:DUF560 domain-containing protein [Carideicomes alvinocaridis]
MRPFALALLLLLGLAGTGLAQVSPAQDSPAQPSPVRLIAEGRYDEARRVLAEQVAGRPDEALHLAFFQALVLIREGDTARATALLRDILSMAPDFEPARRELAVLLARTGQTGGALYHAETLLATTQDPRLRAELESYIATRRSGRPRGVSLRFALRPSSNANNGTEAETVMIGGQPFTPVPGARAVSALGVSLGATAWNRWQLSESRDLTLSASLDATRYDNDLVNDETFARLRLAYGISRPRYRLSLAPVVERSWKNDAGYRWRYGLSASAQYRLAPDLQAGLGANVYRQRHDDLAYLDGTLVSGALTVKKIQAADLAFTLGVPFEIERTERAHLDHTLLGLRLGVEKSWQNGLTTGLVLGYSVDRYKGDYPLFGEPRRDRIATASLSLRHRALRIGPFIPELTLIYTRSRSNVDFFDYTRRDLGLSLTQRF